MVNHENLLVSMIHFNMKRYFCGDNYQMIVLIFCIQFVLTNSIICQPLFQNKPSNLSGIQFNNIVTDQRQNNILIYSNYYGGAGVAIGDLNNDGLQDVYFAGNLVGDRLYANCGEMSFEDISANAGIVDSGSWSSSVIIGDVNNDGLKDIYVTCELYDDSPDKRRNKLYINKGNFVFVDEAKNYNLDNSERTRGATFIDYNKDGWLDIYLLNQPPNPGNFSIYSGTPLLKEKWSPRLYKNTQNGSFEDVTEKAGLLLPGYANSVVAADLNHDGWQDLYVSNDYEAPDILYINNKDGTFSNKIEDAMSHISYYSMGVDIADINNDGLLDIMTLDMVAEDNFRQKANMGGMYPEAFWKLVKQGGHYQYMFNTLQLNQDNNKFSDVGQLAGISNTDWSWSNVIADFDNDGFKDIYVTNGLLRDIRNSDVATSFPEYIKKTAYNFIANNPNAGDVNILDIIDLEYALSLHPSEPISNYLYQNKGDLTFENITEESGLKFPSFSNGCAYGDLDNDGDLDLIVNNINAKAFVFENNSINRNFAHNYLRIQLTDTIHHKALQGSKIEVSGNGQKQYYELSNARGMYSCSEDIAHFGLNNARSCSISITWPNSQVTTLKNINTNQIIKVDKSSGQQHHSIKDKTVLFEEISPSDFGIDFVHKENDFDDFNRQILLPHEMSHHGPALAVGDANGDGKTDFFIGGAKGQTSWVYVQKSNNQFIKIPIGEAADTIYEDIDAIFFDIDQDGDEDLYVVSGGNAFASQNKNYLDRLYINNGDAQFIRNEQRIPRILESGSVVRSFDYDLDGDKDLFIGGRHSPWEYPSPTISRILENQNGYLVDITKDKANDLVSIGMVTDAVWADYNDDNLVDLVIVGEWMPITFIKNTGNGFLKDEDESIKYNSAIINTNGWWNTIAAHDFNGDGKDELIIGNLGLNYKYKASQTEPFGIHYDDFDDNGSKDIILSYYNFGECFPLRGRSCSSQQIPQIKKDFPTYDLFANASLTEIYNTESLSSALEYDAYEFGHILLSPSGNKEYTMKYLPQYTQISSANTIIIDDFDSDGNQDILTGGNMYQSEIETPRNDAGVGNLIKISSTGAMKTLPAPQTGLYLPYDVRTIKQIKIGDGNYLLVACNDDKLRMIKINNSSPFTQLPK